ncbi:MAG: hypothetical protein ACK4M5_15490 [Dietzia cercidiphylli]
MNRQRRRAWIVAVTTLIGALAGVGVGAVWTGDAARYESTATVAIVPFPGLPEDLSADFWQVLSEGQVVRTAAMIYSNGEWAAAAAEELGVPGEEVELSASALVDTTLVRVSVVSGSSATSDAALAMVLGSAGTAAADILQPFVISEASVQPAEEARSGATLQLIGAATVSGALVGAGTGLVLAGIRRRDDGGGDAEPDEVHPGDADRHDPDRHDPDRHDPGRHEAGPGDADSRDPVAGRHAAGTGPAPG